MAADWLQLAVASNAEWCEAIARSHGLASHRTEGLWYCLDEMPPFYPNLVTLAATTDLPHELDLLEATLTRGWGVKDSFASLALEQRGFTALFDAEWYVREPAVWKAPTAPAETVRAVRSERELAVWIGAWGETPKGSSIFHPRLLQEDSIEFLWVERGGRVVAGMATNVSAEVVGISNAFGEPRYIPACIRRCAEAHASRAVVGYGSSAELRALDGLGFRSLGPLRIWLKA